MKRHRWFYPGRENSNGAGPGQCCDCLVRRRWVSGSPAIWDWSKGEGAWTTAQHVDCAAALEGRS